MNFLAWPEIEHLDWRIQEKLMAEVRRRMRRQFWPQFALLCVFVGGLGFFLARGMGSPMYVFALLVGLMNVGTIGLSWIQSKDRRRFLQMVLREQKLRPRRCFGCDYDLNESRSARCPECGEVLLDVEHDDSAQQA